DGYTYEWVVDCDFSGDDAKGIVYSRRHIFNQEEIIHYDSNIQRFEGNTAFGVKTADYWNQDEALLQRLLADKDKFCKFNMDVFNGTMNRRVPPAVKVLSTKPSDSSHPTLLVCHAVGFYPPGIVVLWLRNGEEVKGITSSELLPNGDWTYQVHMYLETPTQSGDTFTCRVQHSSLATPIEVDWGKST
ncbi:HB2C protein, partial [Amia calva]|nr:HB2C protein [Amia calva]